MLKIKKPNFKLKSYESFRQSLFLLLFFSFLNFKKTYKKNKESIRLSSKICIFATLSTKLQNKMNKTIRIPELSALPDAIKEFMGDMGDATVFAFHGDMGSGKTTFINALTRALGVEEDVTNSPSFSIVNEYRSDTTAELIYHFDLYRLENIEEAMDIGIEDYFDSGALCLIEWPDIVNDILPRDTVDVYIKANDDGSREVSY